MKTIKKLFPLTLMLLSIGFFASDAIAQDLDNQGTGKIINSGTIRFTDNAGEFRNANNTRADLQNYTTVPAAQDGIIEFQGSGNTFTDGAGAVGVAPAYGLDIAWRVGGKVLYNSGSGQTMQDRFYTDLETAGAGTISVVDQVYVYRVYTNGGGDRSYAGTFTYDGDDGTNPQIIAPENGAIAGTNRYSTLDLIASDGSTANIKRVDLAAGVGGEVWVDLDINSDVNSSLEALDDMYVGQAAGGIGGVMDGPVTITTEAQATGIFEMEGADIQFTNTVDVTVGTFLMNGLGNAEFDAATTIADDATFAMQASITGQANVDGSLNLAGTTGGIVNLGLATTMNIRAGGSYVNLFQARTNTTYDATSTVTFDVAQVVPSTVAANPYGNLAFTNTTSGAAHTATANTGANDDIFAVGTFSLTDGNLDMAGSTDGAVTLPGNYTPGGLTYAGTEEIVGRLRYEGSIAAAVGTFDQALVDAQLYTMNNTLTQTTFTSAVGTLPNFWEFDLLPGTNPNDYIAATDVNRKITVNYEAAVIGWDATIQAWYLDGEMPASPESIFKYFEADATPASEKIGGTLAPWVRDEAANWLSLAGISGTAAAVDGIVDGDILTGNDLLIRSNDIIYAVDDGRWSNPATWDEFREPTNFDNVVISGFSVHAGFVRPNVDNYTTVEASPTDMAKSLLIDEPDGNQATDSYSSLIFGGFTGGGNDYNGPAPFELSLSLGTVGTHFIDNKSLNDGAAYGVALADYTAMAAQTIDRGASNFAGTREGILIYTTAAAATSEVTMIHLLNSGSVENSGILTIGN